MLRIHHREEGSSMRHCCGIQYKTDTVSRGFAYSSQDSLLRLKLPDSQHGLPIWDTPCSPNLELGQLYPLGSTPLQRLRTFDLNEITDLTFFCRGVLLHQLYLLPPNSTSKSVSSAVLFLPRPSPSRVACLLVISS